MSLIAGTRLGPDGMTLAFHQAGPERRPRIMLLRVGAHGETGQLRPLHDASGAEYNAQISPDGRWVTFVSTESGAGEIYVQPFPGPGPKIRVSTEGGSGSTLAVVTNWFEELRCRAPGKP